MSAAIHGLADEPDVTVTISGSHPAAGKIMIAVSGGNYFLVLLSPDCGFSVCRCGRRASRRQTTFAIQGEVTEVRSRSAVDAGQLRPPSGNGSQPGRGAAPSADWVKM